ncbi:MAG: hypothetical protein V3R25_05865, partial [Nitrosomonadaceae bacterium]
HATSYYKYQEDNDLWVASYRFDDSKWGVLGATFQNSYYVDSTVVAATWSLFKLKAVEFEIISGLVKGYNEETVNSLMCPFGEDSDICFLIAPKVSIEIFTYKGFSPKLSAMWLGDALVIAAGVSYKF